jgi:Domain of unknown function (DUF4349)
MDCTRHSRPTITAIHVLIVGLLAPGCAQRNAKLAAEFTRRRAAASPSEMDRVAAAHGTPAEIASPAKTSFKLVAAGDDVRNVPIDRRIVIYTGNFRIVVKEIAAAIKDVEAIANELGGYPDKIREDSISIRVPVKRYADAIKLVEKLGQVASREEEATDVTEEYVDLEARIKNALAVRARLEALLAKAEDVKAALEVEKELNRVGEEIERLQAKLEVIKNRVAYSTITIQFERVHRTEPTPRMARLPFAWLIELNPNRLVSNDAYSGGIR